METTGERLPADAKAYWATRGGAQGLGLVVVGFLVAGQLGDAGVDGVAWLPPVLGALAAIVLAGVVPQLRWRRWRYEVRDEEIDLTHGTFVVKRTLIPIRRVQHVDTETGPLQGSFELATVTFHTAAGAVAIPALKKNQAERVRARVAELARTRDDT